MASKLLNMDELGDRMPSALMDEMLSLLDNHRPCMLFEQLFLDRMPGPIRLQLADTDFADPRRVVEQADRLWLSLEHGRTLAIHKASYLHRQPGGKSTGSTKPKDTNSEWCYYHNKFGNKAKKCLQPCKFPGGLSGQQAVANAVETNTNRLFYTRDRVSRRRFLVDTGAEVSVLPASRTDKAATRQGVKLTAANSSCMRTFGKRTISLHFDEWHFQWTFTVADVAQPLLGADFLRAHSLLVDIKGQRLIDSSDFTSISVHSIASTAFQWDSIASAEDQYAKLLAEFPDVTTPAFDNRTAKHGVNLFIPTTGPPVHSRARRLPPDKLKIAK